MNARQMAAMAEATRLTRQGRLVEATALIQQTLASPAVTRRPPAAPSAGEETGGTPGRHPAAPAALRAGQGTQLGQVHSGWVTRRTVPSRGGRGLRRPYQPAAPAMKRPADRFDHSDNSHRFCRRRHAGERKRRRGGQTADESAA